MDLSGTISGTVELDPGVNYLFGDVTIEETGVLAQGGGTALLAKGNYEIFNQGKMIFDASKESPFVFAADPNSAADPNWISEQFWLGIRLATSQTGNILKHCRISNAYKAFNIESADDYVVDVDDPKFVCKFIELRSNSYALYGQGVSGWKFLFDGLNYHKGGQFRFPNATAPESTLYLRRAILYHPHTGQLFYFGGYAAIDFDYVLIDSPNVLSSGERSDSSLTWNLKHCYVRGHDVACPDNGLIVVPCTAAIEDCVFHGGAGHHILQGRKESESDVIINSRRNDFYWLSNASWWAISSYYTSQYWPHWYSDHDHFRGLQGAGYDHIDMWTEASPPDGRSARGAFRTFQQDRTNPQSSPNQDWTITDIATANLDPTSLDISWTTGCLSPTILLVGTSSGTYTRRHVQGEDFTGADGTLPAFSHSVSLTGLTAGTTYYFMIGATDPLRKRWVYSTEQSFTTEESGAEPPEAQGAVLVSKVSITSKRSTISLRANE